MSAVIQSITYPRAFFLPGTPAELSVAVKVSQPGAARLTFNIIYLGQTLESRSQDLMLETGEQQINLTWQPPAESPRGYGVELSLTTPGGDVLDSASSAFDVLAHWTDHPRYGFLTDYLPTRSAEDGALDWMLEYHINGLQFYDWMYRHDTYMPPEEVFQPPLGPKLSMKVINELIAAAHARGMAAMPYTAIYAASFPFYEQHPDWVMYDTSGKPKFFGENFLVYMDPRPESPWTAHLMNEFDQILAQTDFDGIHLDQYGDPKVGYDAAGKAYPLDEPIAALINQTKGVSDARRGEDGTVIFNAVTNWPIDTVAPSREDVVYIEVWAPYTHFNDLYLLCAQAQMLGKGKPVVIAAYIDPANEVNARLMDAIIFASGAGRIELGEQHGYLADPYFPKYGIPSADLAARLKAYYEFALRYQNILGPQTASGGAKWAGKVTLPGYETSGSVSTNKVMPVVHESEGWTAVSLVNMLGIDNSEWTSDLKTAPQSLKNTPVRMELPAGRTPAQVWFASPDGDSLALSPLSFEQDGNVLTLTLPVLDYWSVIFIEWSK